MPTSPTQHVSACEARCNRGPSGRFRRPSCPPPPLSASRSRDWTWSESHGGSRARQSPRTPARYIPRLLHSPVTARGTVSPAAAHQARSMRGKNRDAVSSVGGLQLHYRILGGGGIGVVPPQNESIVSPNGNCLGLTTSQNFYRLNV